MRVNTVASRLPTRNFCPKLISLNRRADRPASRMGNEGPVAKSLKGSLILADPSLREPTFFRSVLLLTEHSRESGAFGYILNRPMGKRVGELLGAEVLPGEVRKRLADIPVFMGGPVSTEHLTFSAMGWSEDDGKLQYATHLSAQEALMHQMEGFQIRAFVGYSGWSEGQLEDEFEHKAWIVHQPQRSVIDPVNTEHLWITRDKDNTYIQAAVGTPKKKTFGG